MALQKLGEGLYLYPGSPSTMIKTGEKTIIIDPGHGSKRHKELKRELRKIGVEIDYMLATHAHADHVAIAPKLEKPLFTHRYEFSIAENPLNRELLTFGSKAPKGFLVYQFSREVRVYAVFEWDDKLFGVRTIELPGHSPGMTGFLDEDNAVLYAGDSFFGERVINSVGLPYLIDPDLFKESVKRVIRYAEEGLFIIPSHGKGVRGEEALNLLEFNLKRVEEGESKILELLKTPMSVSELSYSLAKSLDADITPQTLALNQVPIRAIIADLYNRELIEPVINKDLKWRVKS